MNNVIILAVIVYFIYLLLQSIFYKDFQISKFKSALNNDREEMRILLIDIEEEYISELIRNDLLHPNNELNNQIEESINRIERFKEDGKFLDHSINKLEKELKKIIISMKMKSFLYIFFRDLYTLIPIVIILFTGRVDISIIVSGILMIIFSMIEEYMTRMAITDVYGEDVSDYVMSSLSQKILIVWTAIIRQSHFYVTLLILLYV